MWCYIESSLKGEDHDTTKAGRGCLISYSHSKQENEKGNEVSTRDKEWSHCRYDAELEVAEEILCK